MLLKEGAENDQAVLDLLSRHDRAECLMERAENGLAVLNLLSRHDR